jgi:short-subunit dehydrogenase
MREQKAGLIINTSSMGGKIYTPLGAWYHATKHAVEGWSDCLRIELKEFGINVVVLEPGLIDTGFMAGVEHNFPKETVEGPYKRMVNAILNPSSDRFMKGSDPIMIAKTIMKIVNSESPKTRYLVGRMAKPLVRMRKLLGDKGYDRILLSQIN